MPRSRFLPAIVWLPVIALAIPAFADNHDNAQSDPRFKAETAAEAVRRLEYEVTSQPESVIPGHPGGLHVANRAQDLRAYFLPEGVDLVRRTEPEPTWSLRLTMREVTTHSGRRHVDWVTPEGWGRTVSYDRGATREQYENTEQGILVGLTLPGIDAEQSGETIVDLETDLHMETSFDRREVSFYQDGSRVMRLRLMRAEDDQGRQISAGITAKGTTLTVRYQTETDAASAIGVQLSLTGPASSLTGQGISLTPDWIKEINQAGAQFGWSAATAGDVNGDGYSDVIIGARFYDNGQTDEGAAFVYMGSATGLSSSAAWMTEGNLASGTYGFAASTAGDVNGDGYDDVVVGAQDFSNGQSSEGKAWVYLGSASGLSLTPSWTVESNQAGAQYGTSAGTAGDVNGDGYADVIVGAQRYTNTQTQEGRVWLYLGGPTGLSTTAAWFAESRQHDAEFGQAISTAGDVNGDGYSDVLIGCLQFDNGQSNEGRVFVYLGSASGLALNPVWTYESNQTIAYLGFSVGTAGDVNGDGYSDIIVGSDQYDNGETDEGRVFLFHGSATGPSITPSWTAEGNQMTANLGRQVFSAGDVNGDGYSDVIVSARTYSNGQSQEGLSYIYMGSSTGLGATPAWTTEGDQAMARYGGSAAVAGDVNGDGYSDVIVTASLYDNGQTDEGRAFLFHGSSKGLSVTPGATQEGSQNGAALGISVASAGDINGDGFDDLIIGADEFDNGETDEGRAFLHLGSASGMSVAPSWSAEGNQDGALFGHSVATAGDVNGDGFSDLLVGAPGFDNGESDEGEALLYLGSTAGLAAVPVWTVEGDQSGAELGSSVASAGDVNRDGLSDVLIGAPGYDNGEEDEGRVLLFAGDGTDLPGAPTGIRESDQAGALFGASVASAGDVNRDGFSDLLVGAPGYDNGEVDEGRAVVYLGSPFGPALSISWSSEGEQPGAAFGSSVATAGDVNGDGFSDILVGAPYDDDGETDEGRVSLYMGSNLGPGAVASWSYHGNQANAHLGSAVSGAGDVNADGFSDLIVGAPGFAGASSNEGRVVVHYGSPAGPVAPLLLASGQTGALFGSAIAAAGDVDGDGFGDVIIGAPGFSNGQNGRGSFYLHYGNGTHGLARSPRQMRADDSAPVALLGRTDNEHSFRLRVKARSPLGRAKVRLQWEIKPLGSAIDGTGFVRGTITGTGAPGVGGSTALLDESILGLEPGTSLHWRLRVLTDSPYFPHLPWLTATGNDVTETDLRTGGCRDVDGDGFGTVLDVVCAGGLQLDCNDIDATIHPGAAQVCDGINNDCAAPGWPALTGTNEADGDGDTYSICGGDCADTNGTVYPGAAQICDGVNNDCAAPGWPALTGTTEVDGDGDTYSICGGDCADTDATVYPGAAQVCDGVNNDCAAPGWPALTGTNEADGDGDTYSICGGDCADTNGTVYPGAAQICDGVNNDCAAPGWPALTGTTEVDGDGDTYSICGGDCADTDATVYPGAAQVCDGVNNDCAALGWPALTGTNEADGDNDTFSVCGGDCADTNGAVYPGAAQVCDGVNNDCAAPGWPALTGTNEADGDGDTFSVCGGDCADTNGAVYPGAAQICDGLNNDCAAPGWPALTGTNEADGDGDTFSVCGGDCADTNGAVYPGAAQVCDGLNNDCAAPGWPALSGTNEADGDNDTFSVCGGDCVDTNGAVYPGAAQVCDGLNNDCVAPGWPALTGTNEADGDGDTFSVCGGDCADTNGAVYPGAAQVCDGLNNDCVAPGWPALTGTNEADGDGDTFSVCGGDCSDTDATAWAMPGEALDLLLEHDLVNSSTTLSWTSPANPGSTNPLYDVIRTPSPADFNASASCGETDDGPNTTASDLDTPAPDAIFFYLIRAQNGCPGAAGVGPLGFDSTGAPRSGRACP